MASIVEYLNHGDAQGRNFGLKMGVPIQKENEVPLGPDAKGGKLGGNISSSSDSGVWECRELSQRGPGRK